MTTENGRIGRVEGILEEVRTRLNNVENRLNNFESRVEDRFIRLESKVQTQFYWLLGVMITMWVTIILAVVFRI
jgi:hypothetical protein